MDENRCFQRDIAVAIKSTTTHSSNPKYGIINKHTKSLTPTQIIITAAKTIQKIFKKQLYRTRKHKHLGPIAIKHLTNLLNTAINTNTMPHI